MLQTYRDLTYSLIQAPSSVVPLIPATRLDTYINLARKQVAQQGECVRVYASLTLVVDQRPYEFSAISFAGALGATGVTGVYNVRTLWYMVASGQKWVAPRPFEWFGLYKLNNPVPESGPPQTWAQFGQGEQGSLFVDPVPDDAYVCPLDVLGAPEDLTDDATPEAIPDLWRQAVPYMAAYWAYMSMQRQSDADMMAKRYDEFMQRARNAGNPPVVGHAYEQSRDLTLTNRFGLAQPKGGAAA